MTLHHKLPVWGNRVGQIIVIRQLSPVLLGYCYIPTLVVDFLLALGSYSLQMHYQRTCVAQVTALTFLNLNYLRQR
ncbi:hypothetical protein S7335_5549 [Synechococcus sp. PCC 7335]|nr:hypothetical protein S7335_5549 [Synechococcus sp. PCC 7335]